MARYKESEANSALRASLERVPGMWAYKIPDDARPDENGVRRIVRRPCDIIAGHEGRSIAFESKVIDKLPKDQDGVAFSYDMLKASQKQHLPRMHAAGFSTFVSCFLGSHFLLWPIPWALFWSKRSFTRADIEHMPFLHGSRSYYPVEEWASMGFPDLAAFCPCGRALIDHDGGVRCERYARRGTTR